MKKKEYTAPVAELISGAQHLLDSFPVYWSDENGGEIEANTYSLFGDTDDASGDSFNRPLWDTPHHSDDE